MRTETLTPEVGESPAPHTTRTAAGKQYRTWNVARAWVWRGWTEIGPAVIESRRRQIPVPTYPEVQHQFGSHPPVILEVTTEIVELLADEAHRIDLSAVSISEKERS